MKKYFSEHPSLEFFNEVNAAKEEYTEAVIFYSLLTSGSYPLPEEINVSKYDYLLGLGDVPGEFRREALDSLRDGNIETAEDHLGKMEEIYSSLVAMEEGSLLVKGLRRKLDIIRGVIERTRGEITSEFGRNRLREAINLLSEKL
jgi:translin